MKVKQFNYQIRVRPLIERSPTYRATISVHPLREKQTDANTKRRHMEAPTLSELMANVGLEMERFERLKSENG
jgi:hypothetical protein